ncbi:MAG: hypothetical protein PHR36_01135 [Patescibacteria group bacterium]|nr:hypothetical protein [Patescibacteria group bacterium]
MKRIFCFAVFFLFALGFVVQAQEFVSPPDSILYGVYEDGTFFVAKKLVDAVEGEKPKFRADLTEWRDEEMSLSADKKYYFFKAGVMLPLEKEFSFCFAIGGNRYIPHALLTLDSSLLKAVREEDIVDNDRGGYNFRLKPIPVPEK